MVVMQLPGSWNTEENRDALNSFFRIAGSYNGFQQPLADSVMTNFFNYVSQQEANKHEIDVWNMQNDYNSPEKQLQRIVDAGLNPSMAYGSVSSGNASSAPGTHQASYHFTGGKDTVSAVSALLSGVRQIFGMVGDTIGTIESVNRLPMSHYDGFVAGMREKMLTGKADFPTSFSPNDLPGRAIPIGNGIYTTPDAAMIFPELLKFPGVWRTAVSTPGYVRGLEASADLREKQNEVSELTDHIISNLFSGDINLKQLIPDIFKLIHIQLLPRY